MLHKIINESNLAVADADRAAYADHVFDAARNTLPVAPEEIRLASGVVGRLGKSISQVREDVETATRYLVAKSGESQFHEVGGKLAHLNSAIKAHDERHVAIYAERQRMTAQAKLLEEEAEKLRPYARISASLIERHPDLFAGSRH